jgi:ClpP class serine protease
MTLEPTAFLPQILGEINQHHALRASLIKKLQNVLGRNIITFFTSTVYPVALSDEDNDIIECLLHSFNENRGLTMIINSPGGSPLAAERIINTCRSFSDSDFEVIVPRMAKSAATMVCLGANKIYMSKTSELGPIDPQVVITKTNGEHELKSAHVIIKSFEELFEKATKTQGRIEPYLQQLDRYDKRELKAHQMAENLSVDIAVKVLKTGMMNNLKEADIKEKIKIFTSPEETKAHGRPIYHKEAQESGLAVEIFDIHSEEWRTLWELYLRSSRFVSSYASKLCETADQSFTVNPPNM